MFAFPPSSAAFPPWDSQFSIHSSLRPLCFALPRFLTHALQKRCLQKFFFACRLEWEVRKAAANALRLHVAALPALAAALLLMRLALIILIHKAKNQQAVYLKDQPSSTHQSAHQRVNALSMSQTLVSLLDSSSKQVLQRGQLLGLTIIWGSMASWLWPQLALWANWMSHRRPTLPSVLGSVFLIVLTEGLLEALELVAMLMTTCCRLLRQLINKLIVMRSAKVAPCEPYKLQPENCGAQLPKLVR